MNRNDTITAIFVIVDTICKNVLEKPEQEQKLNDAEVITIGICAALYFNSNHEKALEWLHEANYFPVILSPSRYNRRVHRLKEHIEYCMEKVFELFMKSNTYIEDSMPLPVCKRARATRNKKVRGRAYCGYCAAKKEKFFGFRLHMITNTEGIPVSIQILPGALHDLTPVYEITYPLPPDSTLIGDKAFSCDPVENVLADFHTMLMPLRKKNEENQLLMCEERFIREYRRIIETSFSILSEVMGLNRIRATTFDGFMLKTYAAVLALVFHKTFVIN